MPHRAEGLITYECTDGEACYVGMPEDLWGSESDTPTQAFEILFINADDECGERMDGADIHIVDTYPITEADYWGPASWSPTDTAWLCVEGLDWTTADGRHQCNPDLQGMRTQNNEVAAAALSGSSTNEFKAWIISQNKPRQQIECVSDGKLNFYTLQMYGSPAFAIFDTVTWGPDYDAVYFDDPEQTFLTPEGHSTKMRLEDMILQSPGQIRADSSNVKIAGTRPWVMFKLGGLSYVNQVSVVLPSDAPFTSNDLDVFVFSQNNYDSWV